MSVTLLASQCPAPVVAATLTKMADAYTTAPTPPVPTSLPVVSGDSNWGAKINRNLTGADLIARFGGGGYAVAFGLGLSFTTGLTLTIAAGQAMIDGVVEIAATTTQAIADSHPGPTDRAWIWLLRSGVISVVHNSLTPPSANCCLLGSCTTSGGNITAVDTSGVLYLRGGSLYRESADTGMPTDSPGANVLFVHKTTYLEYLWDGAKYRVIGDLAGASKDVVASGDLVYVPTGYQAQYYDKLSISGRLLIDGRVRIS